MQNKQISLPTPIKKNYSIVRLFRIKRPEVLYEKLMRLKLQGETKHALYTKIIDLIDSAKENNIHAIEIYTLRRNLQQLVIENRISMPRAFQKALLFQKK